MSVNKVILVGNVGGDPEIRNTSDGREIANFSLATTESWKDKNSGERKDKTEWHRIVVFSPGLVGVIKNYVKKGSKLYIEGQLQTRKWTDNAGVEKYSTEVVLQNFNSTLQMLDSNRGSGGGSNYDNSDNFSSKPSGGSKPKDNKNDMSNFNEDLDDDIPF
ncbi:MAG: single-strand binding protein [Rickettsiaceae bacterium]|jgi:single-strand DNA-binding protein|nr:single-strand binding protein [Rickettsiaceae bacterium]